MGAVLPDMAGAIDGSGVGESLSEKESNIGKSGHELVLIKKDLAPDALADG